jgi:hypothetical protein
MKAGWLRRELNAAKANVAEWPQWMRDAARKDTPMSADEKPSEGRWHSKNDGSIPCWMLRDGQVLTRTHGEVAFHLNRLEADIARLTAELSAALERTEFMTRVGDIHELAARRYRQQLREAEAEVKTLRAKAALADEQYGEGQVRSYVYWKSRYDALTAKGETTGGSDE